MAYPFLRRALNGVMSPSSDNNIPGCGSKLVPIFGDQIRALDSGHECQDTVISKASATKLTIVKHNSGQAGESESFDRQLILRGFCYPPVGADTINRVSRIR